MSSLIAWLDSTPEEQRAAREIVNLFSQKESRDELGIGQIRDALSDILFPGTSTLHTRARYFLLIPWCYTLGSTGDASGERLKLRGQQQERELIEVLRPQAKGQQGLIGVDAGAGLKRLPSEVYWAGLQQYGIVSRAANSESLGTLARALSDGAHELTERRSSDWAQVPAPPGEDFPKGLTGGLDLSGEEANWLAERIIATNGESVLASLIRSRRVLTSGTQFPWDVASRKEFPEVGHAELFSGLMHGAAILYNLLIAERYDANESLTRLPDSADYYRDELDAWRKVFLKQQQNRIATWDRGAFWGLVENKNPHISGKTKNFVNSWISGAQKADDSSLSSNRSLRRLVTDRELRKGKQSRLGNQKMLAKWSGASGVGELDFRWTNVKTIVNDIQRGRSARASS